MPEPRRKLAEPPKATAMDASQATVGASAVSEVDEERRLTFFDGPAPRTRDGDCCFLILLGFSRTILSSFHLPKSAMIFGK